ncbi:uncharacterized protein LOC116849189 [Odontomachus brunneus]|uniref:uncharacterized protein LOC116849189 n=1 Tax=Odontomachus brunneus TaxID=486640 RepID=UPI0013F1BCEC|nr:uncharacterized protein LOC116849189 [Odontomachus brunneus]
MRPWTTSTSSSFLHRHLNDTSQSNQLICLLMHVHFELCSISRELSTIFGLQMVMQIAVFHLSAMHFFLELYPIILSITTNFTYNVLVEFFVILSWTARCILDIIIFGYVCEKACTKANRVETFLDRLANVTFDVETRENVMQFLLEIFRRPLRISGLGLYDYGFKLVHKFIERSVKMIILVIQAR